MKFGKLILRKIIKYFCHQMPDFRAKCTKNRFWLGLGPRARWGSLQRSPRPPSWIWGLLLRGGEGRVGKWGMGGEGRGREGRREKERTGEGKEGGREGGRKGEDDCYSKLLGPAWG